MSVKGTTIPDHLRGRLAGIEQVSYTSGPLLGNLEAGVVASLASVRASVVSGGVLCVLGVVLVTLVASLRPAFRATRVPPIAAVREGFTLPRGRMARLAPYIAMVVIGIAVVLLSYSLFKDDLGTAQRLISMAVGVLALFVGVAMISSRLVRPLAAFVGWPATRIGGAAGRLAKGNSTRNPGRTASTAAALMIGIALVTFVAVLASGMKSSNSDAIKKQVEADYVLTAQDGFSPFVVSAGEAVGRSPDAQLTTSVRSGLGKALGGRERMPARVRHRRV